MPFVSVPKDLDKVKTKVAFNLTKRQLVCFSMAAVIGIPLYFCSKKAIGNETAVLCMVAVMLPFFFIAMYEKDGLPMEKYYGISFVLKYFTLESVHTVQIICILFFQRREFMRTKKQIRQEMKLQNIK